MNYARRFVRACQTGYRGNDAGEVYMTTSAAEGHNMPPHRVDIPPDRLIAKGHESGDFLEAYDWIVVDEKVDWLRIDAHLPSQVLNPQGQLFGGFTGAYVDMVSLQANRAGPNRRAPRSAGHWTTTINMRIDYYEPIVGPRFIIEAQVEHRRGKTSTVTVRMFQDELLAVYAYTTLRTTELEH